MKKTRGVLYIQPWPMRESEMIVLLLDQFKADGWGWTGHVQPALDWYLQLVGAVYHRISGKRYKCANSIDN